MTKQNRQINAFSLVEIITVIAIIGLLSVAALSYLGVARAKSRDARRVADVTQMKTALEMYFRDEGKYPDTFVPGESLVGTLSSTTYMRRIPSNIGPRTDGDCPDSDYLYGKVSDTEYNLQFCLGKQSTNIPAGYSVITPWGIQSGRGLIYKPNLVGWWDATTATSSTFIADGTGNNNDLTLYAGATITPDCHNTGISCMDFDGVDDYGKIDIKNTILDMGDGEITVSLWLKVKSTPPIFGLIFRNMAIGGNIGYGFMLENGTTNLSTELYPNDGIRTFTNNAQTFTIDEWYLVTVVYQRDIVRHYINGVATVTYPVVTSGYIGYNSIVVDPYIGAYLATDWFLNASMADLRIYNRALTQDEVINIYNQTK